MGEAAEARALEAQAERIAKVCHEAGRVMTDLIGDVPVQPPWETAPEEMRTSCVKGVLFLLENPDTSAEGSHEEWRREKEKDGWIWGEKKDAEKKTHPALMDFEKLPKGPRAKDAMFKLIVNSMK